MGLLLSDLLHGGDILINIGLIQILYSPYCLVSLIHLVSQLINLKFPGLDQFLAGCPFFKELDDSFTETIKVF